MNFSLKPLTYVPMKLFAGTIFFTLISALLLPNEVLADSVMILASGNGGVVGGRYNCEAYTHAVVINGVQQTLVGNACEEPDGTYKAAFDRGAAQNASCQDYTMNALINGAQMPLIGVACKSLDGSWRPLPVRPVSAQGIARRPDGQDTCNLYLVRAKVGDYQTYVTGLACLSANGIWYPTPSTY
jgi:hypothetical protein